jgi:hypothetical protein
MVLMAFGAVGFVPVVAVLGGDASLNFGVAIEAFFIVEFATEPILVAGGAAVEVVKFGVSFGEGAGLLRQQASEELLTLHPLGTG